MSATSLTSLVLGAVAPAQAPAKDTAEARNALVWTREPLGATPDTHLAPLPADARTQLVTPPVADDDLDYDEGGIDEATKRPRVSVLLGPGATIRGIANAVAAVVNSATGGTVTQTIPADELAAALLVYNGAYLGLDPATGQAGMEAFDSSWRVGLRFPLPLEIDLTASRWITNRESVLEAAAELPVLWQQLLHFDPKPLPIPDPVALAAEVGTWLGGGATTAQRGAALARRLQVNPYEPVFFAVEALRQLQPAAEVALVRETLARIDEHQADLIAWTTAGNAAFRRFWATLTTPEGLADSSADDARELVATALGLDEDSSKPGGFAGPLEVGPTVVPAELRLTAAQARRSRPAENSPKARAGEDPGGLHTMVLGRDLCVGNRDSYSYGKGTSRTTWGGPAYLGRLNPVAFAQANANAIGTFTSATFQECLDVVLAIARNEGFLDACRAADAGMISTGVQQWSVHSNTEFPVLLQRFKQRAPDHYDLFFGLYGLQPALWGPAKDPVTDGPTANYSGDVDPGTLTEAQLQARITAANPDMNASTPFGADYPTYCTLFRLDPGQAPVRMPAPARFPADISVDARAKYFGAYHPKDRKGKEEKSLIEFAPEWSGRIRLAALLSIDYCATQLQLAAYRFRRIRREIPTRTVGGKSHTLAELASSEFAAATVLDQHINVPRRVAGDLNAAIARTPAPTHEPPPNDTKLRTDWLMRFAINYLAQRWTAGGAMRNDNILDLHDDGLYPAPGSFTGW